MSQRQRRSAIYTEYSEDSVPSHPGPLWTRFVCLSDTHSRTCFVPPLFWGDVLLHGGDLSSWGYSSQLMKTINWLSALSHPHKIIVAGNHDLCLDIKFTEEIPQLQDWVVNAHSAVAGIEEPLSMKEALCKIFSAEGIVYLEREAYSFTTSAGRTWNVWGSPYSPYYAGNGFQYHPDGADRIYNAIPEQTDILVTHTPPWGILDRTRKGKSAGCKGLARRLRTFDEPSPDELLAESVPTLSVTGEPIMNSTVRLHVFGHIHESRGAMIDFIRGKGVERVSVNAAMYHDHLPIIVDLLN